MQWNEIRRIYPEQWLVIEALEAETTADHLRHLKRLAVVELCADGSAALTHYRLLHQQYPVRELYFVHTSRPELEISERRWTGVRGNNATHIEG